MLRFRANQIWQSAIDRVLEKNHSGKKPEEKELRSFVSFSLLSGFSSLAVIPLYIGFATHPSAAIVLFLLAGSLSVLTALATAQASDVTKPLVLHAVCYSTIILAGAMMSAGNGYAAIPLLMCLPFGSLLLRCQKSVAVTAGISGAIAVLLIVLGSAAPVSGQMGSQIFVFSSLLALLNLSCFLIFTEKQSSSQDIGSKKQFLEAMCQGAESTMYVADADGVIVSGYGKNNLKLAHSEISSLRQLYTLIHVQDAPSIMQAVSDAARGVGGRHISARFMGQKGHYIPVEVLAFHPEGMDLGCVAVFMRDGSEMAAQRELLKAAKEASEKASMAKTRFLSSVSHELRTPLNAILGFSDILAGGYTGDIAPDQVKEYGAIINSSGKTLLQFINQIIDLSKLEAGNFNIIAEPFDVAQLLLRVQDELKEDCTKKNVQVSFTIAEDLPELAQDQRACARIFHQVLHNAISFSPVDGVVSVSVDLKENGYEFTISDQGTGVPLEMREKIFDPFTKLDQSYSSAQTGSGLGLSIVRELVTLQNGWIRMEEGLGGGALVRIFLPQTQSNIVPLDEVTTKVQPKAPAPSRSVRNRAHG